WWQVLLGFFIMHWVAGCILSTVFQMAHVVEGAEQPMPDKTGIIHQDWAIHELHTTSDFARGNKFLNWYVGGLNFQIEHHLFPQISHVHYKNIAPIVEQTAKEFGLNYNLKPTFRSALASHIRRLKELGITPPLEPVVA
ncbi:MAG TPA: fatty acid desaturase, partial [Bacteroidia bacterium]|nr:fatty acid desaturase [Bacteroidia bacterium]